MKSGAYNWGTNMSINDDWMKPTPAAKRVTCQATAKAGVAMIFSS